MGVAFVTFYLARREKMAPFQDFHSFWVASLAVFTESASPYSDAFTRLSSTVDGVVYPYVYPPPSLPLLYPLAVAGDLETAAFNNFILSIAAAFLIAALVIRSMPRWKSSVWFGPAVVLFLLGSLITRRELSYGQIDLYVLLFMLLAFQFRHRHFISGPALALAILLKVYAVVLLPLLVLDKRYRTIGLAAVGLIAASLVVVSPLFPPGLWQDWYRQMLSDGRIGAAFPVTNPWNVSVHGMAAKLDAPPTASFAGLLAMFALTGLAWLRSKDRIDWAHVYSASCLIALAPTIAWPQYGIYVMPAAIYCAFAALARKDFPQLVLTSLACLVLFRYATDWTVPLVHSGAVLFAANVTVWLLGLIEILRRDSRVLDN